MDRLTLDRRAVVRAFLQGRGDAAVVTGLGSPTYDVAAVSPSERNFYLWGAMGGAVMTGLGLSLAQPDLDVIVVTGDGEALMGLGALATVAARRPANLAVLVLDNEHYGETGLQPSHAAMGVDLAAVARGCGIEAAETVAEAEVAALAPAIARFHRRGAPRLANVKVAPAAAPRVMPTRDAVENKLSFRRAIGVG